MRRRDMMNGGNGDEYAEFDRENGDENDL